MKPREGRKLGSGVCALLAGGGSSEDGESQIQHKEVARVSCAVSSGTPIKAAVHAAVGIN